MAEQGEHAVGDEVDGGLVARDQQQPSGGHDVFGRESFHADQPGQQTGAGLGAVPLHQPGHVLVHLR